MGRLFVEAGRREVKNRILVVDDTSVIRVLLRSILEAAGYEVSEAQHGREAMGQVREWQPDLVITDLLMPVVTGQQMVEQLRSDPRSANVPILVLSANPNAAQMAKRADAVVCKPFDRGDLVATVGSLILGATRSVAAGPCAG